MMYCDCGMSGSVWCPGSALCYAADQLLACEHEEGSRALVFAEDGSGYYVWECHECGWTTVDDMP